MSPQQPHFFRPDGGSSGGFGLGAAQGKSPESNASGAAGLSAVFGRRVMVTGAGGSIGSALVAQIVAQRPSHLCMLDSCEFNLYRVSYAVEHSRPEFSWTARICDIRDEAAMRHLFLRERPEIVFHAAALKHVPLLEDDNVVEAVRTNVLGTKIALDLACAFGADFLMISTDKAVNPSSCMGASKRVAEVYVHDRSKRFSEIRASVVRFGNVLGSSGSVVPLFQKQIEEGGPVTVTHPEMTRFLMTIDDAVRLTLTAASLPQKGFSVYVLDMGEPVRIFDLAVHMIKQSGLRPFKDIDIKFVGIRPGEKLVEELSYEWENFVSDSGLGRAFREPELQSAIEIGVDRRFARRSRGASRRRRQGRHVRHCAGVSRDEKRRGTTCENLGRFEAEDRFRATACRRVAAGHRSDHRQKGGAEMTIAGAILRKTVGGGARIALAAVLSCQIVTAAAASTERPSTAQFHVHAGDMIEIAVAGLPELRMRGSVQPDGVVTFPLFGELEVAGLSTAQLREAVQNQFAHKIYRLRTNDGREVPIVIQAEEVSASVVEYGPIYIDGDVRKPGAVAFRPGITARQAIALAGGVEIAALRTRDPLAEASAARSELQSINVKLAEAEAQAAELAAELRGDDQLVGFSPQGLDVAPAQLNQIVQDESNVVQARMADYTRQQQFLQASIATITNRVTVLQKQEKAEEEGARADNDDLQKMIELLKRGNVANPRVLEARRALLMSQTRSLQVADGLLQLTMQSEDLSRQLHHLQDDHTAELVKEAQETQATLAELKVKRDAARERLNLYSMSRARLSVDQPSSVDVALVRDKRNGKSARETIDGDYPLEPGDVIEVAVRAAED